MQLSAKPCHSSQFSITTLFFTVLIFSCNVSNAIDNTIKPDHLIDDQTAKHINVSIHDQQPLHIHPPDQKFTIQVQIDAPSSAVVKYQWLDFQGQPLSDFVFLNSGRLYEIKSPSSKIGYYGLVFSSNKLPFPDRQNKEKREYGFAIIKTKAKSAINPQSPFGVVHANLKDPNLPAWIKTLTWKTHRAKSWHKHIKHRENLGLIELPLIVDYEWNTDDAEKITPLQLTALGSKIKPYFEAHPTLLYWELGIEENLKKRFRAKHYWHNLAQKVSVFREQANTVNKDIKFIYQIAGLNLKSITKFAENQAAKKFAILSLHPYAWPDFVEPEEWLANYLKNVRAILEKNDLKNMPIWFTEMGVPHHGNYAGGFFGYPKLNRHVSGHTLTATTSYMIKFHVLALSMGIEKLFWYNYKDHGVKREKVENHFGLIDFWGYPKPVYAAYINLIKHLKGKQFVQSQTLDDGIHIIEFNDDEGSTHVVWHYPANKKDVTLTTLFKEIPEKQVISVENAVGSPYPYNDQMITIGPEPVFITTRKTKISTNKIMDQSRW